MRIRLITIIFLICGWSAYAQVSSRPIDRAKYIKTDTTNFNNNLSGTDTRVQTALDTLDDIVATSTTGWTDGGANVYLATTTDNVGIGTTNPGGKIEVAGTDGSFIVDASGSQFQLTRDSSYNYIWAKGASADLRFSTGAAGDTHMMVHNSGDVSIVNDAIIGAAAGTNPITTLEVQGTGSFTGNVGIGTTSPSTTLHIQSANNTTLTIDETATGVAAATRTVGIIDAKGRSTTDAVVSFAQWNFDSIDATNGAEDGQMVFYVMQGGVLTTSMNIREDVSIVGDLIVGAGAVMNPGATLDVRGSAIFNEAGADVDFRVEGVGQANALFVQGSDGSVGIGTTAPARQVTLNHATEDVLGFYIGGAEKALLRASTTAVLRVEANGGLEVNQKIVSSAAQGEFQMNSTNVASDPTIRYKVAGVEKATQKATNAGAYYLETGGSNNRFNVDATGDISIPGDVVIGAAVGTNPEAGLHLGGSGHLLLNNNLEIRFKDSGGTQRTVFELDQNNDLQYGGSMAGSVIFNGGGSYTERFRIDDSGDIAFDTYVLFVDVANDRVGIGTTAPSTALQVVGTVTATTFSGDGSGITGITSAGGFTDGGSNVYLATTADNVGLGTSSPGAYKLDIVGDLRVGGTDFFVDDSTGNVGIGTTGPGAKLQVQGDVDIRSGTYWSSSTQADRATLTWSSGSNVRLYAASGYPLWFGANGDQTGQMVLSTSGNVGIGTTGPGAKLDVQGAITVRDGDKIYFDAADRTYIQEAGGLNIVAGSGRSINLAGGDGTDVTVTSTGNVGIGTTGPEQKLDIANGSIRLDEAYSIDWDGGYSLSKRATTGIMELRGYTGIALNTWDGVSAYFDALFIETTTGNVGIGTTSPGAKLEVIAADTAPSSGLFINGSGGALVMKSPDGTCAAIRLADDETLSITSVTCP